MSKFKEAKEKRQTDDSKEQKKKVEKRQQQQQEREESERAKAMRTTERRGSVTGGLQCFKEVSAKIYVHLSPSFLADVPRGIDLQLNRYLLK